MIKAGTMENPVSRLSGFGSFKDPRFPKGKPEVAPWIKDGVEVGDGEKLAPFVPPEWRGKLEAKVAQRASGRMGLLERVTSVARDVVLGSLAYTFLRAPAKFRARKAWQRIEAMGGNMTPEDEKRIRIETGNMPVWEFAWIIARASWLASGEAGRKEDTGGVEMAGSEA